MLQAVSRVLIKRLVARSIERQHTNVDRRSAAVSEDADLLFAYTGNRRL